MNFSVLIDDDKKDILRHTGYIVVHSDVLGYQPVTPQGVSILRGGCDSLDQALWHCWEDYQEHYAHNRDRCSGKQVWP